MFYTHYRIVAATKQMMHFNLLAGTVLIRQKPIIDLMANRCMFLMSCLRSNVDMNPNKFSKKLVVSLFCNIEIYKTSESI